MYSTKELTSLIAYFLVVLFLYFSRFPADSSIKSLLPRAKPLVENLPNRLAGFADRSSDLSLNEEHNRALQTRFSVEFFFRFTVRESHVLK